MEHLIDNIPKYIPTEIENLKPCLLHGDFRLDNMILEKNKSKRDSKHAVSEETEEKRENINEQLLLRETQVKS